MKKLLLFLGGVAGLTFTYAQSLSPQVIASSGTTFSSASSKLEFTIGEVVTTTLTTSGNTLTQGFHQPEIQFASLEGYNSGYTFTLYPNPTEQFVTVESTKEDNIQLHVYDISGQSIMVTSIFQQKVTVDLQSLAAGSYILRITNKDGLPLHSYTVIKKSNH